MCIRLNKALGIACISIMLQVGASSQNVDLTSKSNIQNSNSFNTSSSITANTGSFDVKTDNSTAGAINAPKVKPKQPEVPLSIKAIVSRMNNEPFELPDLSILGEGKTYTATAYALYGRTRSGVYVRRGVIAADPRIIPIGTVVHLKAGKYSGVYTVQDTGRLIKGNVIDVWMPTSKEARKFGRRKVKLHILKEGKSRIGRTKQRVMK